MSDKTRDAILYVGIAAGLILTLFGSLGKEANLSGGISQTAQPIAVLNGQPVSGDLFRSQTSAALRAADDTQKTERELLDTFLAEEMIIAQAIDIGLVQKDPRVRSAILDAMREFIATIDTNQPPSDDELLALYDATKQGYAPPARYQIRYQVITEESPGSGDASWVNIVPSRYLPAGILRRSVGQDAASMLPYMAVGDVRDFQGPTGRILVRLDAKREGAIPEFDTVRGLVVEDWYRLEEEKQYQAYLQKLIREADIRYPGEVKQ